MNRSSVTSRKKPAGKWLEETYSVAINAGIMKDQANYQVK